LPQPRIDRFRGELEAWGVDLAIVASPASFHYFTGYPAGLGFYLLVFRDEPPIVLVPERAVRTVREALADLVVQTYQDFSLERSVDPVLEACLTIRRVLGPRPVGVVGVEKEVVSMAWWSYLSTVLGLEEARDITPIIMALRAVKEEDELKALRRAARVAERGLQEIAHRLRPGVREAELLAWAESAIRLEALEPLESHCTLSPSRPASPEGRHILAEGELINARVAVRVDGYWGLVAATLKVGGVERRISDALRVLDEVMRAATRLLKPGASTAEVDREVRDLLVEYGYSGLLEAPLGHGVGLSLVEPPYLQPHDRGRLRPGMVVALEPAFTHPAVGTLMAGKVFLVGGGWLRAVGVRATLAGPAPPPLPRHMRCRGGGRAPTPGALRAGGWRGPSSPRSGGLG
jgi:Xaa-Pro dipeptidase